jgi:hypothetical protein
MRLDGRQVRFMAPFWPAWRTRMLLLGGRRGSLHLQEPALVLEGELLRFRLVLGIEWLFRRALSEWTTVTVPYSQILAVRQTRSWLVRGLLALTVVAAWVGTVLAFRYAPEADPLTGTAVVVVTVLLGYVAWRVKPTVAVVYRSKAGRRTQVMVWVRRRARRRAFLDALAAHRAAAARYPAVVPAGA